MNTNVTSTKPIFCTRLLNARERSGLTQVEAAKAAGISQSLYSKYENGLYQNRTKRIVDAIAAVVGTTGAWLEYGVADDLHNGVKNLDTRVNEDQEELAA